MRTSRLSSKSDEIEIKYSLHLHGFVILLFLDSRVLVLLILAHEVVHIRLGLCELHLVHALGRVPVHPGLPLEHGRELLANSLEDFLGCCRVAKESG